MAFQMNISGTFQEDLLCIYSITAFGLATSRHLGRRQNHNPAETRQRSKISTKFMSDQPLVHCGQTIWGADFKNNQKTH
jgi:hypothetical protein